MPWVSRNPLVCVGVVAMLAAGLCGCGGGGGGKAGGAGTGAPNQPPVLGTVKFSTKEATDLSARVTATDPTGEALTFAMTSNPTHGSLTSFSANGSFVYHPTPGVTGDDTFSIRVADTGGNQVAGTVTISVHPNQPPVAVNDILRADGTALDSINVLGNDSDADHDALTVSIEGTPLVGSATVNADSTVRISALPGGFKGVTRFKYRITDTSGASAVAAAAVFVGTDPFRVFFVQTAPGSGPEVFVNDLAADPHAVTAATAGTLALRGFVVSDNGATVVYRREDSAAPTTTDLSVIQTTPGATATRITLPAGTTLAADAQGQDQFRVSPDGKWIALIAHATSGNSVYVLNVASPATLTNVSPMGGASAARLRFSNDSQNLYFLASANAGGANKILYTVSPANPLTTVPVSAAIVSGTDDVLDYAISPDQARILLQANRSNSVGLYFVDARQLQAEVPVSTIGLGAGATLYNSTISPPGGTVSGAPLQRVAYTTQTLGIFNTYIAEVSATPNARLVALGAQAVGLRPDDATLLYSKGLQIWENTIGGGTSDALVEAGSAAWFDSTGNIVLVLQYLPSGGSPASYPKLSVTTRGAFGSSLPLGTPGQASHYFDVSGFGRGVVVIGEGATTGAAPTSPRLALVNALAADKLFYLEDNGSPLQLTSPVVRVVTD